MKKIIGIVSLCVVAFLSNASAEEASSEIFVAQCESFNNATAMASSWSQLRSIGQPVDLLGAPDCFEITGEYAVINPPVRVIEMAGFDPETGMLLNYQTSVFVTVDAYIVAAYLPQEIDPASL